MTLESEVIFDVSASGCLLRLGILAAVLLRALSRFTGGTPHSRCSELKPFLTRAPPDLFHVPELRSTVDRRGRRRIGALLSFVRRRILRSRSLGACQTRLHPLAIALADPLGNLAAQAALLHLKGRYRDVRPRLAIYPALGKAAVIHARLYVRLLQRAVSEDCPPLRERTELLARVRQVALGALSVPHIQTRLGTQTLRRHLARGSKQVGMKISWVTVGARQVHGQINGNVVAFCQLARERASKRYLLGSI